eukprot:CAMPEP_0194291828 /NCGR_PEP_ID=MMETSP0169-20130528/44286_1 /TAXON_ID=218684 /ORGANISM="Corethron pennatum, Strain L29A3" /LENGTH=38 /DNA_ID= /DNA_START= /DNA_END= /DNA_ORIENTATION=
MPWKADEIDSVSNSCQDEFVQHSQSNRYTFSSLENVIE